MMRIFFTMLIYYPQDNMVDVYAFPRQKYDIVHIASNWSRYKDMKGYLGGVLLVGNGIFGDSNGFPNKYWGWGGEDDELKRRLREIYKDNTNQKIQSIDIEDGLLDLEELGYKGNKERKGKKDIISSHPKELENIVRNEHKSAHKKTWKNDGLNSFGGENSFYTIERIEEGDNIELLDVTLDYNNEVIKQPFDEKEIRKDIYDRRRNNFR